MMDGAGAPVPDRTAAAVVLAVAELVEERALVRARRPVMRDRHFGRR